MFEHLILFDSGYSAFPPPPPEEWCSKEIKRQTAGHFYSATEWAKWGRYIVKGDSIKIQFFRAWSTIPLLTATVSQVVGVIKDDSTLAFYGGFTNYIEKDRLNKKHRLVYYCSHPIVYKFIPNDSLLPSRNWLQKRGW